MRILLMLTVLLAASFIGCTEKPADGDSTTTTTTTDAMTSTDTSTDAMTTTTTTTTTAPPGPACAVWLVEMEGRSIPRFGGSPPGVAWDLTIDTEDVSVRSVKIHVERQNIDNDGNLMGTPTEFELTTNAQGEATYKYDPPAQTGKFRLTILDMQRASPEGDDCLYDTARNQDETTEDAQTGH